MLVKLNKSSIKGLRFANLFQDTYKRIHTNRMGDLSSVGKELVQSEVSSLLISPQYYSSHKKHSTFRVKGIGYLVTSTQLRKIETNGLLQRDLIMFTIIRRLEDSFSIFKLILRTNNLRMYNDSGGKLKRQ